MTMPQQKPGKSEQAVGTPKVFLAAVRKRLGISEFAIDLAADHSNAVCEPYFTKETDSLAQPWHQFCGGGKGWGWCNMEFSDIYPWVEHAWAESRLGAESCLLVPAATDTWWWGDFVHNKAHVILIQGRFAFVGHTQSYPKGLALLLYAPYMEGGYCTWRWNAK